MQKLTRDTLMSLEQYAQERQGFREKIIQHKKNRQLALSEHLTLYFEDALTMQYQVQEMLRVEKIFEADGIEQELQAYNPLIPDGTNWKATMMLEYPDVQQRQNALAQLVGIEDKVWMCVEGHDKVYAIADEDMERSNEEKTSAVHFLRFELSQAMVADAKKGATLSAGVDHPAYHSQVPRLSGAVTSALIADLA